MRIRSSLVIAIVVASALMAACGTDNVASELEGRWDGPGRATISLNADGTAEGNDGCNEVAAAWTSTGDVAGTFMVTESSDVGCVGVVGWGEASAYVVTGDRLLIEDKDGEDLTELTRTS